MTLPEADLVLVGTPFAPIGMGEHVRAPFRALRSVGARIRVHDVFEHDPTGDADLQQEIGPYLADELSPWVNIFCINGNQISEVLRRLRPALPPTSYNIIWPAWELSNYPGDWAREIRHFHEVWVASRFTEESLRAAVSIPVSRMPFGIGPRLSRFLGRRYFGIPETSVVFLFAFDFLSFVERKNPFAVLEAFMRLQRLRPAPGARLVIKLNNSSQRPVDHRRFLGAIAEARDHVIVIDRVMTDDEIKNLVRCCDCFVSLHRSEGFGFSLAEAMYFRKPVVATGYSGNLDFMSADNSCLVPYRLVPVPEGSYPYAEGQVWAEPDIDAAVAAMARVLDDQAYRRTLGEAASRHLRAHFSYRAVGLRYLSRLAEITAAARPGPPAPVVDLAPARRPRRGSYGDIPIGRRGATSFLTLPIGSGDDLGASGVSPPPVPRRRRFGGWCPICADRTVFHRQGEWLRDDLLCTRCESIPRWRAIVHVLELFFSAWRQLRIHECSPGGAASAKLQRECRHYLATHFFPDVPLGEFSRGFRCEDLERQTFANDYFDLVITQDVFEHVLDPARGFSEVARTLKPGGAHVFTVPWHHWQPTAVRAVRAGTGIKHLKEPEYHGNPIDSAGSLVVTDWGWDLPDFIYRGTSMSTIAVRIADRQLGIAGEFIEVFISRKPPAAGAEV